MTSNLVSCDPLFARLKAQKIGVLMGGRSVEREVSLRSGRGVLSALKRMGFAAVPIDPATNLLSKLTKEKIDIAFLAVHGRWGEDGTLQGFLEYVGLPYTGSGVHASALAMNKVTSKKIFQKEGIPTAPFFVVDTSLNYRLSLNQKIKYPLIVKPINEGSSIGCHKVNSEQQLVSAIKKEKKNYRRLLIEKFIRGKELTVGVLEKAKGLESLPVLELAPRSEFYDYKAKYTEGATDFILPAEISKGNELLVKTLALKAHDALNCHGYSRTDFILEEKSNRLFCLETNTLPGLTALSDIPAQAREAGITYDELVYWLLRSALTAKRNYKRAVYDD